MMTKPANQGEMLRAAASALLAAAIVLGCAVASLAGTAAPTNTLLILDASGSMWGQLEGKTKVEIAKQALNRIVGDLPDGARVGLMLYGHRSKSDCADVELVVPLGPLDRPRLLAEIARINPKGMTPLTASIDRAVEALRSAEGETTIVLVSDGKETCEGDPCAAARRAKEAGMLLVIDVIGFDVGDEERAQLACIAEVTGGRYYPAKNASELELATRIATTAEVEAAASGGGKVWIDPPAEVAGGGMVAVHFEAAPTFHANAWIGIVPSSVPHGSEEQNDQHDLTYEYLYKRTSGTLTLRAPVAPGSYDARLHDSDTNGREVASATFKVKAAEARVWLDQSELMSGQPITIHFSSPTGLGDRAWVGVVPADIQHGSAQVNDQHDLTYSWISGASGTVTLTAPGPAGQYDVRLHDSDGDEGRELAHAGFTVKLPTASLQLDRTAFAPGDQVDVRFQAPPGLSERAWAGVIPSDVPHGDEATNDANDVDYRYLEGRTSGVLSFTAPEEPGSYDVRLNTGDSGGVEIASVTFTVR